jgi:15-cis-phytoene desaturase
VTVKVVVLGGGVGGMSVAHELVERGFQVEVYELRPVAGGKARTIYVEGTGSGGRPDWPGEHGFRFFPGFYKHLPDTMKRIPFAGQPQGVFDNLVEATEYMIAQDRSAVVVQASYPETLAQWLRLFRSIFEVRRFGIPLGELLFFVARILAILTSCQARRLAELEKIAWWDFIDADRKSQAYQRLLAIGLTRTLVALQAEEASTRTVGNILIQLLLDVWSPYNDLDRVLNGPTSELWLDPWLDHLRRSGVHYVTERKVVGFRLRNGQISAAIIEHPDGSRSDVTGDYYVSALPVEQFAPLLSADMKNAEPRLARVSELRVSWMNGIQFFLREDLPSPHGHTNYVSSPSALTSISQNQFWRRGLTNYGDGSARGCLSCDISNWDAHGIVHDRPLRDLDNAEQVKTEVLAQLRAALPPELLRYVDDSNIARWFLDSDIVFPNGARAVNLEPLLINTTASWQHRPDTGPWFGNLLLAADYVRTHTDLACMESANEAARRATNEILQLTASAAQPCQVWPLEEPGLFAPARALDALLFRLGLPHPGFPRRASAEARPRGVPSPLRQQAPCTRPVREIVSAPKAAPAPEPSRITSGS